MTDAYEALHNIWIGRRLRWAREMVYESPAEFARSMGIIEAELHEIEAGDRALSLVKVVSAANKLRTGADYLLMGDLRGVDDELRRLLLQHHPELRNGR